MAVPYRRRASVVSSVALAVSTAVCADGFVQPNLTRIEIDPSVLAGGEYISRVEPERATLLCTGCEDDISIDVLIGVGDIGTERRYRSGGTTLERLETQCRQSSPSCRLKGIEAGAAVGWQSVYESPFGFVGSTALLMRDGELLTIRTIAPTVELAEGNTDALVETIAPQVAGE